MRKNILLPVLLMVMIIGLAGIASAVCTVSTKGNDVILTGTKVKFNLTVSAKTFTNCTGTGTSATTGDTWALGTMYSNATGPKAWAKHLYNNVSITSVGERDASDWSFSFTCYNQTKAATEACSVSSKIVDNTKPTCTWATGLSSGSSYSNVQTWTVTGTNGITATVAFGNNNAVNMLAAYPLFSYTPAIGDVPDNYIYNIKSTVSDGRNTTSCTLQDVSIKGDSTLKQTVTAVAIAEPKKQTTALEGKNLIYIIAGAALVLYLYRKKK